jgi:hypothetical protein
MCIHYVLMNSVLHYLMSEHVVLLISFKKLAILSLTVSYLHYCVNAVFKLILFIDSPSYMTMESYDGIILTEETRRIRRKSLSKCHFVYHTSHMD